MAETSARLLRLLSLLQTPREWSGTELGERLEVTTRTIRRDIERLRDLGYPVEAAMGPAGGYRLVAGTAMPPLLLDDEEAVAMAVGLRTAAGQPVEGIGEASVRALAKLEQVLPSRLRHRVGALTSVTVPLTGPDGPVVDPGLLSVLASTAAGRERLRFAYRTGAGDEARRLVEPHSLVPAGRRWYLVAHDIDRDDWRIFRVDRIREPHPTGQRFRPRELPEADAAAFVKKKMYAMVPSYEVDATLRLPAADARARLDARADQIEPVDEHTSRLRGHVDTLPWLADRLIRLGCPFEVHGPPELVEHLREIAERVSRAAGGRFEEPPEVSGAPRGTA
ncbi:helix-turn-helix transcriptional regulator [Actinomadura xylanilytica]|uniref:helix-turn-helix transcriptional regulator n=1 Tax=Actinomadura xylanilytica TaxID=887459 RepID=UPI00255A918A|nr:WYL domain-containing protein [Actinomadura xylanilytica]MDL4774860.1 WYL domain-containing protein [Actinomadura xylanilytica]